jgi:hypothetical protein
MLIANPKQSALNLLKSDPRVLFTKITVSAAIVLGSCVVGMAQASAEPEPSDTHPNPFGALGCSCQVPALASSSVPTAELDRGIWDAAHGTGRTTPGTP